MSTPPLCIYVDVDDTLVRSVGTKRIPIPAAIAHVRDLKDAGAILFCWSSGGAGYAQASARELGIESCFCGFLPKPDVILDDQALDEWKYLEHVHPAQCASRAVDSYKRR